MIARGLTGAVVSARCLLLSRHTDLVVVTDFADPGSGFGLGVGQHFMPILTGRAFTEIAKSHWIPYIASCLLGVDLNTWPALKVVQDHLGASPLALLGWNDPNVVFLISQLHSSTKNI